MTKIVAIGNFDGVHRGHQAILSAARTLAGAEGTVVALTFWPHPLSVIKPDKAPALLCDITDRVSLLHAAGADDVSIVEFTPTVAGWSPSQFIDRVLVPLAPDAVVVGENFRFGAGAKAGGEQMRDLAQGRFEVSVLPMFCDDKPLSSSRARQAIAAGDARVAAHILGRWFRFSGLVVLGDQRGRTLGFPTANLTVAPAYACVADGVYAGYLVHGDNHWPAAVSVGSNPTFDGLQRRVEAYALDQTGLRLYGERIGVDFVERLRLQQRFDSKEELIDQMHADVAAIRRIA